MRFFRKKRKDTGTHSSRILNGIARKSEQMQIAWATWMNKKTYGFSRAKCKLLLLGFISCAGSASLYLTVSNLLGKPNKTFSVQSISVPLHPQASTPNIPEMDQEPGYNYESIQRIRTYMNSLIRSPDGFRTYDSILRSHPGLADSLCACEDHLSKTKK